MKSIRLFSLGLLALAGSAMAAINSYTPTYQYFSVVLPVHAYWSVGAENFYNVGADTHSFTLMTTPNSYLGGSVTIADGTQGDDDPCGMNPIWPESSLPLSLDSHGNITTPINTIYKYGKCSLVVTGDPTTKSGYTITISAPPAK